jgi:hypothetical protein
MVIKINDTEITFNLDKGQAYVLDIDGATGKTYLYGLLEAYSKLDSSVLAITYNEERTLDMLKAKINGFTGSIVFFDRFDLYYDTDVIEMCTDKGCTVLIDLKSNKLINQLKVQSLDFELEKDKIEVSKW